MRTAIKLTPTFLTCVRNNMKATKTNTSSVRSMLLDTAIPVPAMMTRSQTPYSGPDMMTVLPAEILQCVGANLDANSIKALRLTNRAAAAKSQSNFVKACRNSVTIDMTKVGMRRGVLNLQMDYVSTTAK